MGTPIQSRHGLPAKLRAGFTILEMMVATAVLLMLLAIVFVVISQTSTITRRATDKISAFQGARAAFDLVTELLSQATLNSYWDYDNHLTPTRYQRTSELHFLIGNAGDAPFPGTAGTGQIIAFQAPAGVTANQTAYGGLENLLNAVGFYIEYGIEPGLPSPFPTAAPRYRYRLMQAIEPTEYLTVYDDTTGDTWIDGLSSNGTANVDSIAENIVLMIAWPRKSPTDDPDGDALTSDFSYDSRWNATSTPQPETANQLPPTVQLTMVAIDEASASRLCTSANEPAELKNLGDIFTESSEETFSGPSGELQRLKDKLDGLRINYKIFTAVVPIRESKMQ